MGNIYKAIFTRKCNQNLKQACAIAAIYIDI